MLLGYARLREQGVPIQIRGEHVARVTLPEVVTSNSKPATIKLHDAIEYTKKTDWQSYSGTTKVKKHARNRLGSSLLILMIAGSMSLTSLKVKNYVSSKEKDLRRQEAKV